MFSKPAVSELLKQYVLVQLYTDVIPPEYQPTTSKDENKRLQVERFGDSRLPLYVIIQPDGPGGFKEVGRYVEGKINDVDGFINFLKEPLEKHNRIAQAKP